MPLPFALGLLGLAGAGQYAYDKYRDWRREGAGAMAAQQQQQRAGQIMSLLGTEEQPYQMSEAELYPGEPPIQNLRTEGTGLIGGKISLPQFMAKMAAIPGYEGVGVKGLLDTITPDADSGFTLGPGQARYDAQGRQIASGGADPTTLERQLIAAGLNPGTPEYNDAMLRAIFKPDTTINIGDKPMSITDLGKLRGPRGEIPPIGITPEQAQAAGYQVVEQRTPEQAGKEQMLSTAQSQLQRIKSLAFDPSGEPNWTNITNAWIGTPFTEGKELAASMEVGIQAITRAETGAAMAPTELANTRKRFQPMPGDTPNIARLKLQMFEDFINGSLKLINPRTGFSEQKFQEELARRQSGDQQAGRGGQAQQPSAPNAPGAGVKRRLRFNPATGQLE